MAFFAKGNGNRGELFIYEDIGAHYGGVTAAGFAQALKDLGTPKALDIYIASYGGDIRDGIAIYNQLDRFKGEKIVHVDSIAASIASVIAMAGTEIRIAANASMMCHEPWGGAIGTAKDLRQAADGLDAVYDQIFDTYVTRTGADPRDIKKWMDAETWMTADLAIERGFADTKVEPAVRSAGASASAVLGKFKNVPQHIRPSKATAADHLVARMQMRAAALNRGREPARA